MDMDAMFGVFVAPRGTADTDAPRAMKRPFPGADKPSGAVVALEVAPEWICIA